MAETFIQEGKERRSPVVKGWSLSGRLINTTDLFLMSSPLVLSAPAWLN